MAETPREPGERPRGRLRNVMHRLAADHRALEAEHLQERSEELGATPVAKCRDRDRVVVAGTVRSVTIRPRAGVPALEAELYDGSGSVSLVWLGRRTIAGVDPGRLLIAEGLITTAEGRPVIFNPKYVLRPSGE